MENNIPRPQAQQPQIQDGVDFMELLYLCLAKWKWFVLSVIICLGVAAFYILRTTPVYTRQATLLVKDDKKGGAISSDVGDAFANMGFSTARTNITNELYSINTQPNVLDVVKRLHLDMNYTTKGAFHDNVLYGSTLPVHAELLDISDNKGASFVLNVGKDGSFRISSIETKEGKQAGEFNGHLSDTVSTPVGRIMVSATENFDAEQAPYEIMVRRSSLNATARSCGKRLSVTLTDKLATILSLSYNDVNTQRADDFLSTLISVYNENWVKDKNQIAVSTSLFIDDRLAVIENELGNVDQDISSYKSQHLIPNVDAASNMYMNQASKAEANVVDLTNEAYMARYIRNYLTSEQNTNQLLPSNAGISNSDINSQIKEYNDKLLRRSSLVANSSENNPLVKDIDAALKSLRAAIITSIDNELVTIETSINSQKSYGSRATSQMASNPDQAKYLLSVERQQKVKETLYLYLLQKREENELTQAFTAYNSRVIAPPFGSDSPSAPSKSKIMLLALMLGLAIPFGWIYAQQMLNTKVRGRKDLEDKVTMPFLGEIPQYVKPGGKKLSIKKGLKDSNGIVVSKEHSRNYVNEAFRVLRTNSSFVMNKDANVAVITSYNPGSGKSFIISNLAVCYALKGKKVLLVDCDLRKASSSKLFGNFKVGLTNWLSDGVDSLNDIKITFEEYPGLTLIPVGTVPPNPSELISDDKFAKMIDDARKEYDYIFLDCPPVEIVADTMIVEKVADRTFFIVRAGLFERSMLRNLESEYKNGKYKNMTLILNGTDANSHYGHYGRYGYRYGYHYGYGDYNYGTKA